MRLAGCFMLYCKKIGQLKNKDVSVMDWFAVGIDDDAFLEATIFWLRLEVFGRYLLFEVTVK